MDQRITSMLPHSAAVMRSPPPRTAARAEGKEREKRAREEINATWPMEAPETFIEAASKCAKPHEVKVQMHTAAEWSGKPSTRSVWSQTADQWSSDAWWVLRRLKVGHGGCRQCKNFSHRSPESLPDLSHVYTSHQFFSVIPARPVRTDRSSINLSHTTMWKRNDCFQQSILSDQYRSFWVLAVV